MKKRLLIFTLLVFVLFLTACSSSLTGTWKGRITDGGGFMDVSLTLRDDGTGAVGGSLGDVATGISASFPEYKVTYTTQDGKISFKDEYGKLFHFIPIFGVAGDAGLSPKYTLSGNTLTIEANDEYKLVLKK